MPIKKFKTNPEVDKYISQYPPPMQKLLEELRGWIQKLAPESEEVISYGIPIYKYKGMLVGFGGAKNHCSFFLCSGSFLSEHLEDIKGYKHTKSAVHFTSATPLTFALVKKFTLERMKQNKEKEELKMLKKKK